MKSLSPEPETQNSLQKALLQLAKACGAEMVLLGEVLPSPVLRVRSLVCQLDGSWQPSFSYLLDTHPCRIIAETRKFQSWDSIGATFPNAFLMSDNQLQAYAACPISIGTETNGLLAIMSRRPWRDANKVFQELSSLASQLESRHHSLCDHLEHERLIANGRIHEEFFHEFVLDNPGGISCSEYMPPVPIDLPEEQLLDRLINTAYIVACNRASARMYGYPSPEAMLGARPVDITGKERTTRVVAQWMRSNFELRDFTSQAVDAEGNITWILGSAIGKINNGKLSHFLTKRSDITAQKRYETAIYHKAHHDALTGLPNRYWFQDRIAELIADHGARRKRFGLGVLDLNGFKEVNDTLGHVVGDLILQAVAVRLLEGLKPFGVEIARLGGDEFAILLPEMKNPERGERMASALERLLSEPFSVQDMELPIGGSIGLAMFPDSSDNSEDLLRVADVAMYAAKNEGRSFQWYHPEIDKHSKRRLYLLTSLGPAIENQELFLVYQPKIDVATGALFGFEALLRWQHPSLGLIPPNDFIPFAETNEVIRPLTRWVLNAAIEQGARWLAEGLQLRIAVNISVRNLLDEQLESFVSACLQRHGFPAEYLELEVTESALMTRPAQALNILENLRARKISVAIDDFGTGYSSLAYLARLPVTTLKVDQAFVKGMLASRTDMQIVRSVVGLAHQCQLLVVAEGVEDEPTYLALLDMGCDLAQGYLIARPMNTEAATQWVEQQKNPNNRKSFLSDATRRPLPSHQ